jgi:hypothetical protein
MQPNEFKLVEVDEIPRRKAVRRKTSLPVIEVKVTADGRYICLIDGKPTTLLQYLGFPDDRVGTDAESEALADFLRLLDKPSDEPRVT